VQTLRERGGVFLQAGAKMEGRGKKLAVNDWKKKSYALGHSKLSGG
jgi:hypothetical protein